MNTAKISAVVLAAGRSRRFGSANKLLAPLHGRPLIRHVVDAALAGPLDDVVVVLGHEADRIRAALEEPALRRIRFALNPDYAQGQSTSVRTGLAALDTEIRAAIFLPADQPGITPELLERLCEVWRMHDPDAVVPVFQGRRRSPVLFSHRRFPQLSALQGDQGGRILLPKLGEKVREVEIRQRLEVEDIDTPEEHSEMSERYGLKVY